MDYAVGSRNAYLLHAPLQATSSLGRSVVSLSNCKHESQPARATVRVTSESFHTVYVEIDLSGDRLTSHEHCPAYRLSRMLCPLRTKVVGIPMSLLPTRTWPSRDRKRSIA